MTAPAPGGDAVRIDVAARLIGLTPDRVRQLVRAGHAVSPARGQVGLTSLLRGYTATLRAEAARPASAALARHQSTKAALIEEATTQRRQELWPRAQAYEVVEDLADVACEHLSALGRPANLRGLPADLAARLREEAKAATSTVEAARATALAALTSGDFSEVDG